jgi:aminopeptidase N
MTKLDRLRGNANGVRHSRTVGVLAATLLCACGVEPRSEVAVDDLDDDPALAAAVVEAGADLDGVARFEPPRPGDPGIGDTLFPTLGNGGYEALHYAFQLRYETADPTQSLDGTVLILARATQSLSRFDLDFAGDSIGGVQINGRTAAFQRDGEELVITPAHSLLRGQLFLITVTHFVATPQAPDPAAFAGAPFFSSPDGTGWAFQPYNAHRVFPCNDHPSDKASFSFRVDVPAGTTAVASGVQTSVHTFGGRTIYRYEHRAPMATELVQLAVGAFTVIARGNHAGVTVRDVVPTRLVADLEPKLAVVTDHIDFMENLVGDYPFPTYGSFSVDAPLRFALETQTLTVYDGSIFAGPPTSVGAIMVHELAHQWFGDSVSPRQWTDVWQNEGHAGWYELSFRLGLDSPEFTSLMQLVYSRGDIFRGIAGPVARPPGGSIQMLFNANVYQGGALVLYALRQQIGDAAFQSVERAWVTQFRGRAAGTEDFIALATQVSGQDVTAFLNDWLFGTKTPAMPGHPDWTVTPFPPTLAGNAPTASDVAQLASELPLDDLGLMRH